VPIGFGVTILQVVPFADVRDDAAFVESLGLDNAWVVDHFAVDGAPELVIHECWTTVAALAATTDRIRIGTMVTNVALRNPGLLAKAALTVDGISGGRLDLAVGGGFYPGEHAALGIDFLDGPGRGERLREAVEILDRALRGENVTYEGVHFRLDDAPFHPAPTQLPRPGLWVAGQATRSLRLAVQHADALVCLGEAGKAIDESLPVFRSRMARLDELCIDEGRDPATLRRCYFAGWADEPMFESSEQTRDFIGRYVEAGATDFTFYLHNPASEGLEHLVESHRMATREQVERTAAEVFPAFRN
jgi:alkanesulfonate monooxygenase SsuD/methylene tetrahydromethanopterin reductase-like flavin-dependent oxidoreductase (luciferase family)